MVMNLKIPGNFPGKKLNHLYAWEHPHLKLMIFIEGFSATETDHCLGPPVFCKATLSHILNLLPCFTITFLLNLTEWPSDPISFK